MSKIHIHSTDLAPQTFCGLPLIVNKLHSSKLNNITPKQLELGGFCKSCLKSASLVKNQVMNGK